eukprot:gene8422-4887_t
MADERFGSIKRIRPTLSFGGCFQACAGLFPRSFCRAAQASSPTLPWLMPLNIPLDAKTEASNSMIARPCSGSFQLPGPMVTVALQPARWSAASSHMMPAQATRVSPSETGRRGTC